MCGLGLNAVGDTDGDGHVLGLGLACVCGLGFNVMKAASEAEAMS